MHDGSLQENIFNIKNENDKLANTGGLIGGVEGGKRRAREKGKIGQDATLCLHTYFFKKDLSHLSNGFYGLFLIS